MNSVADYFKKWATDYEWDKMPAEEIIAARKIFFLGFASALESLISISQLENKQKAMLLTRGLRDEVVIELLMEKPELPESSPAPITP